MQPDILRFLLDCRTHLRDGALGSTARDGGAPLPAADRALPDDDWFGHSDGSLPFQRRAAELFPARGLQFDA